MSTHTAPTSTFPTDDWDERTERIYTGEVLEDPPAQADPLTPEERQRQEYGGISIGAAFFGWLSAVGLMCLLAVLLAGAGAAFGLVQDPTSGVRIGETTALSVGIAGAVLLVVGVYAGSYAAGRLVRFDGGRQGAAVWTLVLVSMVIGSGLAVVVAESDLALNARSSAPELAVAGSDLLLWGGVTFGVAALLALLAAIGGAKLGVRYHAKVDLAAHDEPAEPVPGTV